MGRGQRNQAQTGGGLKPRGSSRPSLPNLDCIDNEKTKDLIQQAYKHGVDFRKGSSHSLVFFIPDSSPIRQQIRADIQLINHQIGLINQPLAACIALQRIDQASSMTELMQSIEQYTPSASLAIQPRLEAMVKGWRQDIADNSSQQNQSSDTGSPKQLNLEELSDEQLFETVPDEDIAELRQLLSSDCYAASQEVENSQIEIDGTPVEINPETGIIDADALVQHRQNLEKALDRQKLLFKKLNRFFDPELNRSAAVTGKDKPGAHRGFEDDLRKRGYHYYLARQEDKSIDSAL